MLLSYIRVALRHLSRRKVYAAINVVGLAVGMACCLLIALFVQREYSFDDHHANADRIVRVALDAQIGETHVRSALSALPLASAMESEFPEVETATRLWRDRSGEMTVFSSDHEYLEPGVAFADANFFSVFSHHFVAGNPETALAEPNSIVLTASMANKYFGDTNPIGETLELREPSDRDLFTYTVTGVIEDTPASSHLDFDFLASFVTQRQSRSDSWLGFGVFTYALLDPGASTTTVENKLATLFEQHAAPRAIEGFGMSYDDFIASGQGYQYFLQPLTDIHLHSSLEDEWRPNGNAMLVNAFSAVALLILLIACINFTNLATARSSERAREVGVRKVLGAERRRLVTQFLVESVLLAVTALIVALVITTSALPAFSNLAGEAFELTATAAPLIVGLLIFALLVGVLAGSYPAFYLSRFSPAAVLKSNGVRPGRTAALRNGLVVFQFAVSIVLIAGTATIYRQMDFLASRSLGFDREQVVVLDGAEVMGRNAEAFRESIRGIAGIESVTNAEKVPGRPFDASRFHMEGQPEASSTSLDFTYASFDFIETMGMELVAGRSLDRGRPEDSLAVILSETAVRHLGLENPVGQRLVWPGESTYTIVGVVRDFHIASLHHTIRPVALLGPDPRNTNRPNLLVAARLNSSDARGALASIESAWTRFAPRQPFSYAFLDQEFEAMYRADQATGRLIATFAGLALLIACIGLFGLAAFTAERRTKEVGIRKVLGATAPQLVALLSRDFVKLIGISFVVAAPLAYLVSELWLQGFAYRAGVGVAPYLIGGVLTLVIAMLTVSVHAARAALANPVSSLRYE